MCLDMSRYVPTRNTARISAIFLPAAHGETEQIMPTTYGKYKRNADTISKERECSRNDATSLTEELIAKCDSDGEEKV